MVISYVSLCVAVLTLLCSISAIKRQKKRDKQIDERINNATNLFVQSNKEAYFDRTMEELTELKHQEISKKKYFSDYYLEKYFDLLFFGYESIKDGKITEKYWNKMLDFYNVPEKKLKDCYKTGWKKMGYKYNQDFSSFVVNEILKN